MKIILLRHDIATGPNETRWAHATSLPSVALLGLAVVLATACGDELSCTETATCPPNANDSGSDSDAEGGDRDGTTDRQDHGDAAGSITDTRAEGNLDTRGTADTSADATHFDAHADATLGDASEAGRSDGSTDARTADRTFVDTSTDNNAVDGPASMDGPGPIDDGDAKADGDDASTIDASDSGGMVDVVVGCNTTTCPTGCCDTSNRCVTTPSNNACGGGGATCQTCTTGQACNGAACVCTANSCTMGCCADATTCLPFAEQSDTQCGAATTCSSCTASMQACDKTNGRCACTSASCPSGCCSGTTCKPYSAQDNSSCGTGGNTCRACSAGQKCGGSGSCVTATWCDMQAVPSGVAAGDYQCLDFDTGMPSSGVWVPEIRESGILQLVSDQVSSVPNSLRAFVGAYQNDLPPDLAHLTWRTTGNLISAVTVTSDVLVTETFGNFPNGYVDYLCVTLGGTKGCLSYRYPGTDAFAITFPETGPPVPFCNVNLVLPYQHWLRLELTLSNNGDVTLSMNGSAMTCSSGATVSSGASSVQVGAASVSPGGWGDIRLDNLGAYLRR